MVRRRFHLMFYGQAASSADDGRSQARAGWRLLAGLLAGSLLGGTAWAEEEEEVPSSARCIECHTDREAMAKAQVGADRPLLVDAEAVAASVHGSFECADCHENLDAEATPHRETPVPVDCFSCHDDTGKKHKFHANLMLSPPPEGKDTSCVACHGGHEIVAVKSKEFRFAGAGGVGPLALAATGESGCVECHKEATEHFAASAHGTSLRAGDAAAPNCFTCHGDPKIASKDPALTLERKLAQTKLCESCHVEKPEVASHVLRGTKFVESFERSVHGAALQDGNADAATCVDCHGAHEMNRAIASGALMHKQRQPETCAKCHEEEANAFGESVHAAALRKGNGDSPACTDCHGEHDIRGHTDPLSPVHATNVAQEVCATCHASLRLTQKYGLSSKAFQTFADSYHGLATRGGAVEVVNCGSCHSAHAIKSHLDPTSTVHKSNLVQTCGECHPGANTRFTVGSVHVSPESALKKDGNHPALYFVSSIYVWMIAIVVGGMAVHNVLDFLKKIRRKLAIQKGLIEPEHLAHRLYVRMTVHERLQHGVLVISFVLLVVTGFMLRYPEAWWVMAIRNVSAGAFEWRSLIHRVAGVVMLAAGAWHIAYLVFTKPGRALLKDLWPQWRDVTDPWKVLRYNVGLSPTKPAFGRFSYIEKAEYWALVWGTILMGITGVILWFDNTSMGLITKLGFDISRTIHFYEAILATLAIVVWHFYFVIFNPDVYPMNLSWLTGRMSEEEMYEEHPLELARLKALEAEAAKAPEEKKGDADKPGDGPGAHPLP